VPGARQNSWLEFKLQLVAGFKTLKRKLQQNISLPGAGGFLSCATGHLKPGLTCKMVLACLKPRWLGTVRQGLECHLLSAVTE